MDGGAGGAAENSKNNIFDGWWSHEVPVKSTPNQQLTCTYEQQDQQLLVSLLESDRDTRHSQPNSCSMSMSPGGFSNWESCREASFNVGGLQINPTRISFQELMALAEGKTVTSTFVRNSTSFCFQPNISSAQFSGYINSQPQELRTMPEMTSNSKEDILDTRTGADAGRTSVAYVHPFDLNSSAIPEDDDHQQRSGMNYTSDDESDTGDDVQKRNISDVVMELQRAENPCQINDQVSATCASVYFQENQKLDKGNREEPLLIKSSQEKPRRKKHRPKVIVEGQSQRNPKVKPGQQKVHNETFGVDNRNGNSPIHKDTPVQKRKYIRRKGIHESQGTMDKEGREPPCRITRNSCRRSLNFNMASEERNDSSSYCPLSDHVTELPGQNYSAEYELSCKQGMDASAEKNDKGISQELQNIIASNGEEDYLGENQGASGVSLGNYIHFDLKDKMTRTRGNSQIGFFDAMHDTETVVAQGIMESNDQTEGKSINEGSIEPELCNKNKTGTFYNTLQTYNGSLQAGLPIFSHNTGGSEGLDIPKTCKRKRTEKIHTLNGTSLTEYNEEIFDRRSPRVPINSLPALTSKPGISGTQCEFADDSEETRTLNGIQIAQQNLQDLYASGCSQKITRQRSKCLTRPRDLASFLICKEMPASPCKAAHSKTGQNVCMETLLSGTHLKIQKKKRAKRRMLIKSTEQVICSNIGPATTVKGLPLALKWNYMSPLNTFTQQFNRLDLKASSRQTSVQELNAFLPLDKSYQYALVPYEASGSLVPSNRSTATMKQRQRPKVDLDEETTRVWKLLLENIDNEGIDGTDEENAKWWEAERRIFNGRADSFIARMHLVQGDRRFSPWKGSVVDSVVGVFLTQNVSDHLSSSAFMSIAARFPITINDEKEELHQKCFHTEVKLPEVIEFDPDGTSGLTKENSNHCMHGEITETHHESKTDETRGDVRVKFPGQTSYVQQEIDNTLECEWLKQPCKPADLVENEGCMEETVSSQATDVSSQNSAESRIGQAMESSGFCFSNLEYETTDEAKQEKYGSSTSLGKLLELTGNLLQKNQSKDIYQKISKENVELQSVSPDRNQHGDHHLGNQESPARAVELSSQSLCDESISETQTRENSLPEKKSKDLDSFMDKEIGTADVSGLSSESSAHTRFQSRKSVVLEQPGNQEQTVTDATRSTTYTMLDHREHRSNKKTNSGEREVTSYKSYTNEHYVKTVSRPREKRKAGKVKEIQVDWDELRRKVLAEGRKIPRTVNTNDSVDWDAVRCADVNEIAETIKARGMNNNLAERIKEFLNRLVREHGSIDLEWLRDISADKAKEYLLSFRGLGLKSVECVRLLTLHHLAFPVDTNVGRIAVRLGWVPLQTLPESLQLHLLELYPVLESIQKYLWPRLCKLDQKTLYELHYQMITFGKVFCTKSKPNCNACPMRAECRHFASAFASARLALPGPEKKTEKRSSGSEQDGQMGNLDSSQLPLIQSDQSNYIFRVSCSEPIIEEPPSPEPEPIIEMPTTPEPDSYIEVHHCDIDNVMSDSTEEIPKIQLNMEEFNQNLQKIVQQNTRLHQGNMSKALVAVTSEAASIPVPKLKNVRRLRTEHRVYELPDSHPLLKEMDKREPDDPSPYLLAIWTPGETANSIEQPQRRCSNEDMEKLCTDETCSSCNNIREANSQTVRGTILIPCRTAMRGSFPLNGTYFQVNEVFSDHDSSLTPIDIPRDWLWNLPRRIVYFGTSIPTIFRGLTTQEIEYCFWRGFVCVRGFERKTRAPRPLIARLHFPASKLTKGMRKGEDD